MLQDNTENITVTPAELCQLMGDERPSFALRASVVRTIDELRALAHSATSPEADGQAIANALHAITERLEAASTISSRAGRVAS